jgi:Flp pilus assembly protein TadG
MRASYSGFEVNIIGRLLGLFASLQNRLRQDRAAGIAVMTALSLPVIVAAGGFTVDVGIWDGQQTALQAATDSAAVKAARDLAENPATTPATLQADALSAANAASAQQFNLTAASLQLSQLADARQVKVNAAVPAQHFFSQVLFPSAVTIRASSTAGIAYTTISSQASCYAVESYTYLYSTGFGTIDTSHSSGIDSFKCGTPPTAPAGYSAYCGGGVLGCNLDVLGLGNALLPFAFQIGPNGGPGGITPILSTVVQTLNGLLGAGVGSATPLTLNQGSALCPGNVCTIYAGVYNGGITFGPGLTINFEPSGTNNTFLIENGNLVVNNQDTLGNTDPSAIFYMAGASPGAYVAATQVQINTAPINSGAIILTSASTFKSSSLIGTQTSAPLSSMAAAQQDALSAGLLSILGLPGQNLVGTNFLSVIATCANATSTCASPNTQPATVQSTIIPSLALLQQLVPGLTAAQLLSSEAESSTTTITSGVTFGNGVPTDWTQHETANSVLTNTVQTLPSALSSLGLSGLLYGGLIQGILNTIAPNETASQSFASNGVFTGQTSQGTPSCAGQPVLYSQTITPSFGPGFTDILNSAGMSGATGAVSTSDTVTVCGTSPVASITPITPGTIIVASTAGGSSTITLLK